MKKLFSDESGATSVLVIFMMIVLVTLGAYSIVSAHVNYSFSQRALNWNKDFYSCDYLAEGFMKDLDLALAEAEKATAEYVLNGGNLLESYEGVPIELQSQLWEVGIASSENARTGLNLLYRHFAYQSVERLRDRYRDLEVSEGLVNVSVNFSIDEGKNSNLRAVVKISPLSFDFSEEEGIVFAIKSPGAKRCEILKWEQWQEEVYEDPTQDLWDGLVE
jgi:hypothetical protein